MDSNNPGANGAIKMIKIEGSDLLARKTVKENVPVSLINELIQKAGEREKGHKVFPASDHTTFCNSTTFLRRGGSIKYVLYYNSTRDASTRSVHITNNWN